MILFLYFFNLVNASKDVNFAFVIWRHGERSPIEFIPQFNDSLELWPHGEGQLTTKGIQSHQGKYT